MVTRDIKVRIKSLTDLQERPHNDLTDRNTSDAHPQSSITGLSSDVAALNAHIASTVVHGVTGTVVGTTNSQTISNKTLDNTNTTTVKDVNLTIQGNLDMSKQMQFDVSSISPATTRKVTLQDSDITMESTIGSQTKVNTHSALTTTVHGVGASDVESTLGSQTKVNIHSALTTGIHGFVITTPVVDQILKYNGINFINGAQLAVGAGPGVIFYLDATEIIPPGPGPQTIAIETLSKTPTGGGEVSETVTVNNSTGMIDQYLYNTALNILSIPAGEWTFDTYCYVDDATNVSQILISVGRVFIGAGTIAITGAGTSRTATVTGGTPFLASDYNVDISLTSYIITPTAVLRIVGYTSDSVVTVETLATYSNETDVTYSADRFLFQDTTGEINNTVTPALFTHTTVEPAFASNVTDKLTVRYYGKTDHVGDIVITIVHNGTTHYTRIHTPLPTLHNDLAGLQGGSANEYFHLTSAEYTGTGTGVFVRQTALGTMATQNASNVAITGGSITGTTITLTGLILPVVTKLGAYILTTSDYLCLCDATGGTFTISLPATAGITGRQYIIKKIDSSGNSVTIDGNLAETIDGALTRSLNLQYEAITIQTDGLNWFIV